MSRSYTSLMLDGTLGVTPTVDVSFELYLDGGRDGQDEMTVDLYTGARIAALAYDTTRMTAKVTSTGDFASRHVVFSQRDRTKLPSWGQVQFTLDGQNAPWTDNRDTENLFTLQAAGLGEHWIHALKDTLSGASASGMYQLKGGVTALKHDVQQNFPVNGGMYVYIRNAATGSPTTSADGKWQGLRLVLKDAAGLTEDSLPVYLDGGTVPGAAPVYKHLGPVVDGNRFFDVIFLNVSSGTYGATAFKTIVFEAPILKYLTLWRDSDPQAPFGFFNNYSHAPLASNDAGIYVRYRPDMSYSSGIVHYDSADAAQWRILPYNTATQTPDATMEHNAIDAFLIKDIAGLTATTTQNQFSGDRFDVEFGNPLTETSVPFNYRHMPHAIRNLDIEVTPSPSLQSKQGGERAHFNS